MSIKKKLVASGIALAAAGGTLLGGATVASAADTATTTDVSGATAPSRGETGYTGTPTQDGPIALETDGAGGYMIRPLG